MNKSSKRWKVFVIVLCMLFTMTPGSVFADDSPPIENQQQFENLTETEDQSGDDESDKGDPEDPNTPPGESDPEDPGTPRGSGESPTDGVTEGGTEKPEVVPSSEENAELMKTVYCPEYGTLKIKKVVNNKPNSVENAEFKFTIEKKFLNLDTMKWDYYEIAGNPFTIVGAGVKEILVETGTYRITEQSVDNYRVDDVDHERNVWKNNTTNVTFTNTYTGPTTGYIKITKMIDGDQPSVDATFKFLVKRHGGSNFYVTITGAGTATTVPLRLGSTYTVTEVDIPADYTPDAPAKDVLVNVGENSVTFTNTYTDPEKPTPGSITLTKYVESKSEISDTTFTFDISGPNFSTTVAITTNTSGSAVIEGLVPGEYDVVENQVNDFYPTSEGGYEQTVGVEPGVNTPVTFTNRYDPEEEPTIKVTKEVAPYTLGAAIPTSGFEKSLTLTSLNQSVIYRVSYSGINVERERSYRVLLSDIYDRNGTTSDITSNLRYWDGANFAVPDDIEPDVAYYYIDTLPANGTYTNTAYLYEPQYRTLSVGGDEGVITSSSAVVVVNYSSGGGGGGGGGGGSRTTYYEVTYNANWPAGADLSGTVPTDSKNYTYNTSVSVKGNTDGLKAGTYTFEGWNTKADGTGTMYLPGNTFNIKEDTILYAQWKLVGEPVADDPVTDSSAAVSAETADLDDVPKTGDAAPLIPMLLLGLLSLAAITLSRKKVLD